MIATKDYENEELKLIALIGKRARAIPIAHSGKFADILTLCHTHATPMKLQALLDADELNFVHDMVGITDYHDPETGEMHGGFVPRYAGLV